MGSKNKKTLEKLITIFGKEYDFLGQQIYGQPVDYHHIDEDRNNTEITIENGAILLHKTHEILHKVELVDYELYQEIKVMFRYLNDRRKRIDTETSKLMKPYYDRAIRCLEKASELQKEVKVTHVNRALLSRIETKYSLSRTDYFLTPGERQLHFIDELYNGGQVEETNAVSINNDTHKKLHKIEVEQPELYKKINDLFRRINSTEGPLSPELQNELSTCLAELDEAYQKYESDMTVRVLDDYIDGTAPNDEQYLLKQMIQKYQIGECDWLLGKINNQNRVCAYQFRDTKIYTNGIAPLTMGSIGKLKKLRLKNPNLYNEIIYWLGIANDLKGPLTEEVDSILRTKVKEMEHSLGEKAKKPKKEAKL